MATWLVTGANRGIGLELTRRAAAQGHRVFATIRNPSTADELARSAGDIVVLTIEATDAASFASAAAQVGASPIDVVVANAGEIGPRRQSVAQMDYEGFEHVLAVNTLAPLRLLQTFLVHLQRAAQPKFVVVSSQMASINLAGSHQLAYSASKSALNRLMRGAAVELAKQGIAVGIFSPGWVRTDMGGSAASIDVAESVGGLLQRIEELDLATSGRFVGWDGKTLPW